METNEIEEYARVYAEINLNAILFNLEQMKRNIHPNTKIIGVIKADGYGHGAVQVAEELEKLPFVEGYATATFEEAEILRKCGMKKPILILGYTFPYSYEQMIQDEIRPAVFRKDMVKELSDTAVRIGKKALVHVKVDTGMSRIGIRPDALGLAFIKELLRLPGIELEGIFTHFAKADTEDLSSASLQQKVFQEFVQKAEREFAITIPVKHCSNSAGIIRMPSANLDVVRAGITMYGLWPSSEVEKDIISLQPVMSLKSHIVYIKEVEAGVAVSYGGTFVTKKETRIATIPVGYADGYPRSLSNKGYVLIQGKRAPIIGRVCMDQMMVDVTDIDTAKEGNTVVLLGEDGKEKISAEDLGELSGRFNYELVCDIGKRVPRVFFKNGKVIGTKDYFNDYR